MILEDRTQAPGLFYAEDSLYYRSRAGSWYRVRESETTGEALALELMPEPGDPRPFDGINAGTLGDEDELRREQAYRAQVTLLAEAVEGARFSSPLWDARSKTRRIPC